MSRVVTMSEIANRRGRTGEEGTPLGFQGVLDWLQSSAQALDVGSLVRAAHGAPDEARFWGVLEGGVEHVLHNPPPDMTELKRDALRGLQLALRAVRDGLRSRGVPNALGGGVTQQPCSSKRRRDKEVDDDDDKETDDEEEEDEEKDEQSAGEAASGLEGREASEESSEMSEGDEQATVVIARIEGDLQRLQQQHGDETARRNELLRAAMEGEAVDNHPGQTISADQLPALLCTAAQTTRATSNLDLYAVARLGELIFRAKNTPATAAADASRGNGKRRVRCAPSLWAELKAGRGDAAAVAELRTIPPSRCKCAVRLHLLAVLMPNVLRVSVGYSTIALHATAILEHVRTSDAATQALWGF